MRKVGRLVSSREVALGSLLAERFEILGKFSFIVVSVGDFGHAITEGNQIRMSYEGKAA